MDKILINRFFTIPEKCKYCNTGIIKTRNNNGPVNTITDKCNNCKYNREYFLRKTSILENSNITPSSIFYTILELWLVEEKIFTKIIYKLKELYSQPTIDRIFTLEFLGNCRAVIANYLRTNYTLDPFDKED